MNIKTITFSPTGGTKAVADILARTLDPDPFDIDLTDRFADHEQVALAADDLVVIAMPCFCGRVPVLAAERFAHIRGMAHAPSSSPFMATAISMMSLSSSPILP